MKKHSFGRRFLSLLLVFALALSVAPLSVFAAKGDLANVSTGLDGDIDTADTISLPVKILDYEADGMLFEFAEAAAGKTGVNAVKTAKDFGATWAEDYTTRTSVGGSVNTGNLWSDVTLALKTGTYANYTRMTWKENTTANWTGNRAGVVMADFTTSSTYTTDQVRYMVVVFRSNVRSGNFTVGLNRANLNNAGTDGNYTGNMAVTTENNTNWTYAILDLKNGTLGSNWSKGAVKGVYVGLPIDASSEWMDLAHVAFFSDKDQATAFAEYALTDGSDRGDNRAFGLLRGSRNQAGTIDFTGIDDVIGDGVQMLNTYGSSAEVKDYSTISGLGYTLLGTFGLKGIANIGLLESGLSAEGNPVYKKEVVDYMASLLKDALEVTERTSDGWKNYRYVKGTASSVYGGTDLATALRKKINGNMGSYAAASGKDLVGTWAEVSGNIASYYDAAYFLLNSIFVPGSYNVQKTDYNYLVLSAGKDSKTGDKTYVFDGGFATSSDTANSSMAIDYDKGTHTIQNTSAAGKAHFYYESSNTTTLNPFLPITDRNTEAGMTKSPYYQDDGVINGVKKQATKDTLYKRNFGFAMVSEGEFVYHADDELFFEFEGDDDVYLFINGELVLDIGSAHSIDIVRFELNDYVNKAKANGLGSTPRNKALALEEGGTYEFKFYYMERHSYGSNIRIATNIKVTDPSMNTTKTAWQNGSQLDFGSIVDKDGVVEYGFSLTNNGEENLFNLTFTDNDIGVSLDPTNGLKVTGSNVYALDGTKVDSTNAASKLLPGITAVVSHPDYDDITVTFADQAALKKFLQDLTAEGTEAGGGLFEGATVQIRGIGYKLTDAQIKAGVFDNTVFTTATNQTKSKTLYGQATMRVFVPADPMYYQWAGHKLSVTKTKLIDDVLKAANTDGNILAGKVANLTTSNVNKIELVTKAGNAISSPYVSIDGSYNLTINYDTPGSKVFYVKVTYNSSKNTVIVPVLVNVTDVKDSVYVLDYGLPVTLTDNNELFKNDTLTVPGRSTNSSILGIGSNGAYSPNEITFSVATDNKVEAAYGDFVLNGQTLKFTPDSFMEGASTTQIAVNVYETASPSKINGTLDINREVEMYKTVITVPANVVYYEDNFPAITYPETTNTIKKIDPTGDLSQSPDQDENYGHDGTYEGATEDKYSGGSLTTITINDYVTTAQFEFTGTGFELIGRTNATDSATLVVTVLDNQGNTVKVIPVITQFDNGNDGGDEAIYQVPVIRVKGLTAGKYTVQISGVPAYDYTKTDEKGDYVQIPTYLYIDGLRIYQPLAKDDEGYYDEDEKNAQFIELRDQIVQGFMAVAKYSDSDFTVSTGTSTWTENLAGETEGELDFNEVTSVADYLIKGPNNEVYMTGTYENSALVFYVKETGDAAHSLQIALRGIDETLFNSGIEDEVNATVSVGVHDGSYSWTPVKKNITSSTEQYYTIDYTKCFYDNAKGAYQVVVRVDDGMVSFSNLKLTGLELVSVDGEKTDLYYKNGILSKYLPLPQPGNGGNHIGDTGAASTASASVGSGLVVDMGGNLAPVNASEYVNFLAVRAQLAATEVNSVEEETEVTEPVEPGKGQEPIDTTPGFKPGKNRGEIISGLVDALMGK